MRIGIPFGTEAVELELLERQLLEVRRGPAAPAIADVGAAVRQALEGPSEFPPLRRALTPDDHVAIVVRDELSRFSELLAPLLEHVVSAGVRLENVTLICPPRPGRAASTVWYERLPAELRGAAVEIHDPADRGHLAYLASTKAGRRIYLNRTLVDADQVIVLGRVAYDPVLGYAGGLGEIFPALSDTATRSEFALKMTTLAPTSKSTGAWQESQEVGWLLGMPFILDVLEGAGDDLSYVFAGSAKAVAAEAERALNRHWRATVPRTADVVVAGIGGDPSRQTFADVAGALACAARVVQVGGSIVVLSRAPTPSGPGVSLLQQAENVAHGLRLAREQNSVDILSVWQLATAAQHARLYLYSEMKAATVEELFMTPLEKPEQAQRLVEGAEACLLLPDAQRTMAVLE